jgi:hypothetical protein
VETVRDSYRFCVFGRMWECYRWCNVGFACVWSGVCSGILAAIGMVAVVMNLVFDILLTGGVTNTVLSLSTIILVA